jgi:uncharacterized membrane protein YbjE (DUF340 family)
MSVMWMAAMALGNGWKRSSGIIVRQNPGLFQGHRMLCIQ